MNTTNYLASSRNLLCTFAGEVVQAYLYPHLLTPIDSLHPGIETAVHLTREQTMLAVNDTVPGCKYVGLSLTSTRRTVIARGISSDLEDDKQRWKEGHP